jgi:parallel beta helix pectate lyase-like protein
MSTIHTVTRRGFLKTACTAAALNCGPRLWADDLPPVTAPRATDGDAVHEPKWDEQFTITVGPKKADLVGTSDRVIQAAVDTMARRGGGTVRLLPGTYTLRNAVHLSSGIRLLGSGSESMITKIASETVPLADDSNWFDQEITLEDAKQFRVGDGVLIRAKNPHSGSTDYIKRTLVARSGNRFKLDDGLRKNVWLSGKPTCSSLFPLLTSENTADVVIENLTLDGNGENNENLNGNYAGCVFLQDCNRYTIRNVEACNYNGDGISFQVCHDVVIDDCYCHDNANLGVHPGSGSQRPLIRNSKMIDNNIGLFWCWGVKYGLAEGNEMVGNRCYGSSIGHCDTDNVMRNNRISNSGKVGILFRDENRGRDFWPNRNLVEDNVIVDSGGDEGVAIDITGKTRDVRILRNEIRETRGPAERTGIRIGPDVGRVELDRNKIEGFADAIVDQRTG